MRRIEMSYPLMEDAVFQAIYNITGQVTLISECQDFISRLAIDGFELCSLKTKVAATDSQQLQAKIRAIVIETEAAQNGNCDAGEILSDLVADLRVLSAM
jgi:hypothetical protein